MATPGKNVSFFGNVPFSQSLFFLVASNLLFPLFGILVLDWSVAPLLFLYWAESAIIGFFNVAKMVVSSRRAGGKTDPTVFFAVPFFIMHYSGFMIAHLIVLTVFFSLDLAKSPGILLDILMGIAFFLASHYFSFVSNYVKGGEHLLFKPFTLLFAPYGRIIAMHVAIIFGAFLFFSLGSPKYFAVILVVLKTAVDAIAHVSSHMFKSGEKRRKQYSR